MSSHANPHLVYIGDQIGAWTVIGFEIKEEPNGSKKETVIVSGSGETKKMTFKELLASA